MRTRVGQQVAILGGHHGLEPADGLQPDALQLGIPSDELEHAAVGALEAVEDDVRRRAKRRARRPTSRIDMTDREAGLAAAVGECRAFLER